MIDLFVPNIGLLYTKYVDCLQNGSKVAVHIWLFDCEVIGPLRGYYTTSISIVLDTGYITHI